MTETCRQKVKINYKILCLTETNNLIIVFQFYNTMGCPVQQQQQQQQQQTYSCYTFVTWFLSPFQARSVSLCGRTFGLPIRSVYPNYRIVTRYSVMP
jgi:hypothetical protein